MRSKGKAVHDIIVYLEANGETLPDGIGQSETIEAVTKAVDALYDAYETDGAVPSRERFAGCCEESSIGRAVLTMPKDPFVRKALSRKAITVVTVQAAYDEQVLVSAAWDETAATGYTCSTCGATK